MRPHERLPSLTNRWSSGAKYSARGLAVCLSFILAACSSTAVKDGDPAAADQTGKDVTQLPNLKIAAVGDIMLGTDFPDKRLPPDDISLLGPVSHTLRQADVTIGNLEGVLQDGGEPVKRCANPKNCYLFRTPGRYVNELKDAGFDVLSLANNHARDFGEQGRDNSMAILRGAGIAHTGRDGDSASIRAKGRKIAVIAFAPYQGSNNMLAHDVAQLRIRKLAKEHDIVIVTFHGGAEGAEQTRIPFSREFYHGEDRGNVVKFSRMAIDAGADLVVGHGPHVPRALELYQERLIAYSLGNFATYWGIKVSGINGLAPILSAELDSTGRFISGTITSARQMRPAGPIPDESHTAARMIRSLTIADFPGTPLLIDHRGNIRVSTPSVVSGAPPDQGSSEIATSIAQTD